MRSARTSWERRPRLDFLRSFPSLAVTPAWGGGLALSDYSRVAEAIGFLCREARAQPCLDQVAAHVGLSPFHFQRMFQHWAGISPKRFLQFLTLGEARLLLRGASTALAASLRVGFTSPSRLHDLFVNLEGMTPGQYLAGGRGLTVAWAVLASPMGPALFVQREGRLQALRFLDGDIPDAALEELGRRWPLACLAERPAALKGFARILVDRLGCRLDLPLGAALRDTPLQLKVWEALLYAPQAGSAAGRAVARLIPCHLAIRASGALDRCDREIRGPAGTAAGAPAPVRR